MTKQERAKALSSNTMISHMQQHPSISSSGYQKQPTLIQKKVKSWSWTTIMWGLSAITWCLTCTPTVLMVGYVFPNQRGNLMHFAGYLPMFGQTYGQCHVSEGLVAELLQQQWAFLSFYLRSTSCNITPSRGELLRAHSDSFLKPIVNKELFKQNEYEACHPYLFKKCMDVQA